MAHGFRASLQVCLILFGPVTAVHHKGSVEQREPVHLTAAEEQGRNILNSICQSPNFFLLGFIHLLIYHSLLMTPSCYQLLLEAKIQMIAGSKINCFYSKMLPTQHMSGWVAEAGL